VAYATAHVAAQIVNHFPKDLFGVYAPETLPAATRRAVLSGIRKHGVKLTHKMTMVKTAEDEDELL
jgi:hypothetical protein